MKYRTDFVTNSSSSSFICAFISTNANNLNDSTIEDIKSIFKKFINGGILILQGKDFKSKIENIRNMLDCDWIRHGSSLYSKIKDIENGKYDNDENYYILVDSYGGAGDNDSDFLNNPDDWKLDYDVDLEDFSEYEYFENVRNLIKNITSIEYGYGAGRNE